MASMNEAPAEFPVPIYLDNAASTRPAPDVLTLMAEVAGHHFANPSSAHAAGAAAARLLDQARRETATALRSSPEEIVFTGGGTEANALAIIGAAARARGRHLVVTAIEHSSVLRTAERLASQGRPDGKEAFELTVVPVGPSGVVSAAAVAAAVRPDTAVVAVMLVNNELGTVQPVAEIAQAISRLAGPPARRPHLHVDAVQAFGFVPFRPAALGADSIAISGHKLHGPKGTGALWLRPGARVSALWDGGGQERGLRSGTENLPGIAGLARAAALAAGAAASGAPDQVRRLREAFEGKARALVPGLEPTVSGPSVAPHISSLRVLGLPAEPLLHALDARGVVASAGSACASKSQGPSHVLKAIGIGDDDAVLRFSLSRETTAAELDRAAVALAAAVAEIRKVTR
jgi:cysteine desulfurase